MTYLVFATIFAVAFLAGYRIALARTNLALAKLRQENKVEIVRVGIVQFHAGLMAARAQVNEQRAKEVSYRYEPGSPSQARRRA